jgi:hypothetical protein
MHRKARMNRQSSPGSRRWPSSDRVSGLMRKGWRWKCREAGRERQKRALSSRARRPMAAIARRQGIWSASTVVRMRPVMPPKALPAMYSPMAAPMARGDISSLR